MRYYLGVDWADAAHTIWVEDEHGAKVLTRTVPHTAEGLAEWGRWLDEQRARGIERCPGSKPHPIGESNRLDVEGKHRVWFSQ
jgi:hypothetical protein